MAYNSNEIEKKWEKVWEENKVYKTDTSDFSKPKYYILDMFPYPSGSGLHVGHIEGYSFTDAIARYKRAMGFNVLHPIGFDSFGLPAEQFSIKNNMHPGPFTDKNIDNFIVELKRCGFSYDWDRVIKTSDPKFYKFTQEIFLRLYNKGLAYYDKKPVNYCPMLGTVLANEEVIDGRSERGGYPVERILLEQWNLRITAYADKLIDGLNGLDWPISTIQQQIKWIGKSNGVQITFKIKNTPYSFDVFTTRVDTLFGCTYAVLAPENPIVDKISCVEQKINIERYRENVSHKSDMDRTNTSKSKTGIFTGAYAINPINGREIPIYIGDYVLGSYGTGAVMAVPGHDQRDYEFAKEHGLPIIQVVEGGDLSIAAYEGDGPHMNSSYANGLNNEEAKEKITLALISMNAGKRVVNYKLRDWLFSRQRYWGEPIPMLHRVKDGKIVPLSMSSLPLELPELDSYLPSKDGKPPLNKAQDWVNVTIDGVEYQRETNTMPQWAGSSWYYARFIDPNNEKEIGDSKLLEHWLPVDLYIGGAEHAVLHLLYSRFWHKFLYEEGIFKCEEPFKKLRHQGVILGPDGNRMSKSKGNTVSPDDVINEYGADSLRLYELFKGPIDQGMPWNPNGPSGASHFIERIYRLYADDNFKSKIVEKENPALDYIYNSTLVKVKSDYEELKLNTAISQMMVLVNEFYKADYLPKRMLEGLAQMIAPITPHLGEEIWSLLGHDDLIDYVKWPEPDMSRTVVDNCLYIIQVNGKLRAKIEWEKDASNESIEELKKNVFELENVSKFTSDKEIVKIIVVPNKIINIVVK